MPRSLGVTSLAILAAVRDDACYGLDIVAHTGLASGTVYPTLGRLRRRGLLSARWEDQRAAESEGRPRRRYYSLSEAGHEALSTGAERLEAIARKLSPAPREAG